MITCIALDDEPFALEVIKEFCSRKNTIDLKKCFTKASDALKYLKEFPVDLLFLDIKMPDISGINFYKSLPRSTLVIFTTAYTKYAVEGFNLQAVDYLLKPYTFERFEIAVLKATQMLSKPNDENFLYVRSEYNLVKIPYADINYIEGLEDYVKIHLISNKTVLTRLNIKGILEKLPSTVFIRVHRSFIVPASLVKSLRNKKLRIGEIEIPIGPLYEKDVMKLFGSIKSSTN
jgi:DNA-binding LytR/AlgR family response regulator